MTPNDQLEFKKIFADSISNVVARVEACSI
jgi:hypothetical protein